MTDNQQSSTLTPAPLPEGEGFVLSPVRGEFVLTPESVCETDRGNGPSRYLVILLAFGVLIVLGGTAVAPFIYTLF